LLPTRRCGDDARATATRCSGAPIPLHVVGPYVPPLPSPQPAQGHNPFKPHVLYLNPRIQAKLTIALDVVLTTHAGPARVLGAHTMRCKRTAMYVDNGIIKVIQIAEAEDDPAGDDKPEATLIETMLPLIAAAK